MRGRVNAAALTLLGIAAAAIIPGAAAARAPSQPSPADRAFSKACVEFLARKGLSNPSAAETAVYLNSEPVDMRIATPRELNRYFGKILDFNHVRGYVPTSGGMLFIVENRGVGIILRSPAGKLVSGKELETVLEVLASIVIHETSHVRFRRHVGFPVMGIIQDELLAHLREARYLDKELALTPEMAELVAKIQPLIQALKNGASMDSPEVARMQSEAAALKDRVGEPGGTMALMVSAYRKSPADLAAILDLTYARGSYWNIYAPADGMVAGFKRGVNIAADAEHRGELANQVGFWSTPGLVARARAYFDRWLPEYKSTQWPTKE
ncbi:MAG: hypothetical protein HY077_17965 [Elusimicrobia bacterium]|nr:hypothetical protein [Elusimicrobiota bacterium]